MAHSTPAPVVHDGDLPHPAAVASLVETAAAHDGVPALNEAALRALRQAKQPDQWWVTADGEPAGEPLAYAALDAGIGQLVVHPEHRQDGLGEALLAAADIDSWWAFGDLADARAVAERLQMSPVRTLLKLGRPLTEVSPESIPDGVVIRPFTPADATTVIEINAAAFAHHPEQGAMDENDFLGRAAEEWFDPAGLLLAVREEQVIGFHWTKVHRDGTGEVYVLAVRPDAAGGGIGRALLAAGLDFLRQRGCTEVILYVEGDQERVVRMYRAAGFETLSTDVVYASAGDDQE
ncbi:mycothiol synthase [Parenemella sanctibonifatiensis]|uniref:Mycothiol acetyltransferase n=1 Tax=Parenemella sanctibonifatiensis TaxID=2016505 RepID=A0A255DZK0_9ACTN|nr:mycothiol synthase [Parenemella sanctibonifatiensis]OYN84676.1 mycothiol synthase [Parenemella sanctibonifatiensis]